MLLMVLFFILPFPQLTLETLVLWWWLFSPHLFAYTWVRQQWTGSWVHLTGGFLVLVFSFSLPLSLSVVLVPQLVCSFMETLKMSETLISRD